MRRLALLLSLLAVLCLAAPARSITVQAGPPVIDTAITAGPAPGATIEDDGTAFAFSASRDGEPYPTADFSCSLDGAAFAPCQSPKVLDGLAAGLHSFAVFAEDPEAEVADAEPASRSFGVFLPAECEAEEDVAEEDEDESDEAEEGSEEPCAEGSNGAAPPRECVLRSVRADLIAYPPQERVRLVLRYTTFAPTDAVVSIRLGGHGSARLIEAHRHLARQGLLRLSEKLSRPAMARVRLARRLTVETSVAAAPASCRRYAFRHLTVRHAGHGQVLFTQADSVFGADA